MSHTELHETIGVGVRQITQEHGVEHTEDCRIRAYAECERQDRDECETGRPKQPA